MHLKIKVKYIFMGGFALVLLYIGSIAISYPMIHFFISIVGR